MNQFMTDKIRGLDSEEKVYKRYIKESKTLLMAFESNGLLKEIITVSRWYNSGGKYGLKY